MKSGAATDRWDVWKPRWLLPKEAIAALLLILPESPDSHQSHIQVTYVISSFLISWPVTTTLPFSGRMLIAPHQSKPSLVKKIVI